jgi:hypothetical protein
MRIRYQKNGQLWANRAFPQATPSWFDVDQTLEYRNGVAGQERG